MAVREYIGARYVPVFADPIQWDQTKAYEQLTFVQYNSDTYISRKPVPAGKQITDSEYWLLFASYSAQYDSLRTQLNSLDSYTRDTLPIISGLYNVIDYGADPTGSEYSYQAIMDTAAAADGKGYIYFPAGTYKVNAPLDLSGTDHFGIIGDGAIITSDIPMQYLMCASVGALAPEHKKHFHDVKGITFNGDGKVASALLIRHHAHVTNCNFTGFTGETIAPDARETNASGGARIENCSFYNDPDNTPDATAIHILSDSFVTACRIWGYKIGIYADGSNIYDDLYFWNRTAPYETTGIYSPAYVGTAHYSNIEFDTINKPCHNSSGNFQGCSFLYNGNDVSQDAPYFMVLDSANTGLRSSLARFDNCIFRTVNDFVQANLTPFTNVFRRVELDSCQISGFDIKDNQLYELASDNMIEAHETVNCDTAGTWYRIATAYFNQPSTRNFFVMYRLAICSTGRCADFAYSYSDNELDASLPFSLTRFSLLDSANFGIIKDAVNQKTDFYVKPKTSSISTLQFSNVIKSLFAGSFVNSSEATELTDADMDTII